ncbi:IS3 family transposase [Streptomyces sp. NPDC087769]|uniref:IS3 family transposase n=1 Tax=Streptomyces sp. NPDC087769 TaxID=3365802 RepID=UPI0037FABC79
MKGLCCILGIVRPSFYHWRRSAPLRAVRQAADAQLAARIRVIHRASDGTCGVPRITAELREDGERVNHERSPAPCRRSGWPACACAGCIAPPSRPRRGEGAGPDRP